MAENMKSLFLKDYLILKRETLNFSIDLQKKQLTAVCKLLFVPIVSSDIIQSLYCNFVVRLNAKQIEILEITTNSKNVEYSYPSLREQANLNQVLFRPVRDLNSLNAIQRVFFAVYLY